MVVQYLGLVFELVPFFLFKKVKNATIGAKITHQNFIANANNFARTPALAKAFTPKVPATNPPILTAAVLSPDL